MIAYILYIIYNTIKFTYLYIIPFDINTYIIKGIVQKLFISTTYTLTYQTKYIIVYNCLNNKKSICILQRIQL